MSRRGDDSRLVAVVERIGRVEERVDLIRVVDLVGVKGSILIRLDDEVGGDGGSVLMVVVILRLIRDSTP